MAKHLSGCICFVVLQASPIVANDEALRPEKQVVGVCNGAHANIQEGDEFKLLQKGRISLERILVGVHDQSNTSNLLDILRGRAAHWSNGTIFHAIRAGAVSFHGAALSREDDDQTLIVLLTVGVLALIVLCVWGYFFADAMSWAWKPRYARSSSGSSLPPPSNSTAAASSTLSPYSSAQLQFQKGGGSLSPMIQQSSAPRLHHSGSPLVKRERSREGEGFLPLAQRLQETKMGAPVQITQASMAFQGMPSPLLSSSTGIVIASRFVLLRSDIQDTCKYSGSFNIMEEMSRNVLFTAAVRCKSKGYHLEIRSNNQASPGDAICTCITSNGSSSERGGEVMDIFAHGGGTYGRLELQRFGPCIVRRDGRSLMSVDGDPERLNLWIESEKGDQLASARPLLQGDDEYIDIRVRPGMDVVLALSVLFAVTLFHQRD